MASLDTRPDTRRDARADLPGLDGYSDRGYAILDGLLSPDEVAMVNEEALRVCRGERGAIEGAEPAAPGETDDQVFRRYLCIHMPHKISPVTLDVMRHPAAVEALTRVIGPDVKAMQSMLFIKAEGKPGQAWHQDEFFIPTRDRSLTAIWIALDDATVENGCLWALPGSHRPGVIYPDREHDDLRFDCTVEAYDFPYRDEDAVALELPARLGPALQRLPAPPLAPQHPEPGPAPGPRPPLHERELAPAVAAAAGGCPHGQGRLPRRGHGRRPGPVRLEGLRRPGNSARASR